MGECPVSPRICLRSPENTTYFCWSILGLSRDRGARGERDGG